MCSSKAIAGKDQLTIQRVSVRVHKYRFILRLYMFIHAMFAYSLRILLRGTRIKWGKTKIV